jgi:hypothetical protein
VLDVPPDLKRRSFLNNVVVASSSAFADPAFGRSPGSLDVEASLQQISTAASTLADLRRNWDSYAVIDAEGRAGDVDRARRVLGGVAPQNKPSSSPLYKVSFILFLIFIFLPFLCHFTSFLARVISMHAASWPACINPASICDIPFDCFLLPSFQTKRWMVR